MGPRTSERLKLTDVLSYRINVLSRAIDSNAELKSVRHIDMTLLETRLTHYLYENESSSMVNIARDMCVDLSQVSRMVASLVEKGQIERKTNPEDGRSTIVSLTERGRASVAKRTRSVLRWNEILADQLSEGEFRILCVALDKLIDFTRRSPSESAMDNLQKLRSEKVSTQAEPETEVSSVKNRSVY